MKNTTAPKISMHRAMATPTAAPGPSAGARACRSRATTSIISIRNTASASGVRIGPSQMSAAPVRMAAISTRALRAALESTSFGAGMGADCPCAQAVGQWVGLLCRPRQGTQGPGTQEVGTRKGFMSRTFRFIRHYDGTQSELDVSLRCTHAADALLVAASLGGSVEVWDGERRLGIVGGEPAAPPAPPAKPAPDTPE